LRNIHSNVYPEPEDIVIKYFDIYEQVIEEGGDLTNASRRIYTNRVYMYGDAITEYITENPEQNAQENDDLPPGMETLDEGYGYGSWIRASVDRDTANCSVELDEVLGIYVVRCIAAELSIDQELRLQIPKLVKSRREIYSGKFKPTEIQETLELDEEVLQEPMEERPQEATVIQTPVPEEKPDFDVNDLNEYLVHAKQVDDLNRGYDTIGALLDPLRVHTSTHGMRHEDTALTRVEGMVIAHHRLYTRASECLRQGDKKQAISLAGAVQILQEMIEGQYSNVLNKIGRDKRLKEYVRVANEIDAATARQRERQGQNLEQLRTTEFSYDFTRIPEYAIGRFPGSSSTPRVETIPVLRMRVVLCLRD
jgi:hypothetical protein